MDLMDYRRKIIANSPHLKSASGAVATFSDGANLPLKSLLVNIEPVQSGSGDPSPTNIRPISGWDAVNVAIVGKNLWHPVSNYPATDNGITYSLNADGSIHVQGTASGQSNNYPIASNGMSIEAGTYTMSVRTTDPNIHFVFGGGNGTAGIAYTDMVNGSKKTFTTNGGTTGHNIVRINSGVTVNGDIYIQLEKGSTATSYEPYNGITLTTDLGQTVYGGTLNVLTGVLTVDAELEVFNTVGANNIISSNINYLNLDSSVNIVGDYTRITFGVLSAVDQTIYNRASNTYTNKMCNLAPHKFSYNDASTHWYRNTALYLFLPTSLCGSTSQSVLNYLISIKDTTPLSLWIPLATPYTIQLTPHQIRTLYGSNTIFADTGNVALEYWAHP